MRTIGQFNNRRVSWRRPIHIFSVVAVGLISIFQICDLIGLRINASPSLPIGLYVVSKNSQAELVEFCPAKPFAKLAAERGYRSTGSCSDRAAPLLKPIAAEPGDSVELSGAGISVNGQLLPNTVPLNRDTQGRPLNPWSFGRYIVAPGTIWVASTFNARSFDSRYFGPIQIESIRDRVRPLLTAW